MLEEKKSIVEVNVTEPVTEAKAVEKPEVVNVSAAETTENKFVEKPVETVQSKAAEKQVEEMLKTTNLGEI